MPADRKNFHCNEKQGDQIEQNFTIWAKFFGIGRFFIETSLNALGEIEAVKKSGWSTRVFFHIIFKKIT
jgi:hypothetical protein